MSNIKQAAAMAHLTAPITSAMRSIFKLIALVALPAWAAPERVVSVNICTDQYAILFADKAQIAALSYLSRDAMSAVLAEEAMAYPAHQGAIEEIALYQPDLVLAHEWTSPNLLAMFERLDIPYLQISDPTKLEDIPAIYRQIGAALGQEERAEAAALAFESRLASIGHDTPNTRPLAAIYGPGGYVDGANGLSQDILQKAGFDNLAERLSLDYGGFVSLEDMLLHKPDLLITADFWPGHSEAETLLAHPALTAFSGVPIAQTDPRWSCGLPSVLDAVVDLTRFSEVRP